MKIVEIIDGEVYYNIEALIAYFESDKAEEDFQLDDDI